MRWPIFQRKSLRLSGLSFSQNGISIEHTHTPTHQFASMIRLNRKAIIKKKHIKLYMYLEFICYSLSSFICVWVSHCCGSLGLKVWVLLGSTALRGIDRSILCTHVSDLRHWLFINWRIGRQKESRERLFSNFARYCSSYVFICVFLTSKLWREQENIACMLTVNAFNKLHNFSRNR